MFILHSDRFLINDQNYKKYDRLELSIPLSQTNLKYQSVQFPKKNSFRAKIGLLDKYAANNL